MKSSSYVGFDFDVHVFRSAKRDAAIQEFCGLMHKHPPVMIFNYEGGADAESARRHHQVGEPRGRTYLAIDESIQPSKACRRRATQTKAVHALAAWEIPTPMSSCTSATSASSDRPAATTRKARTICGASCG